MKSIGQMVQDLDALRDTKPDALGEWAFDFIENMVYRTKSGKETTHLSVGQAEKIEELWKEHCSA